MASRHLLHSINSFIISQHHQSFLLFFFNLHYITLLLACSIVCYFSPVFLHSISYYFLTRFFLNFLYIFPLFSPHDPSTPILIFLNFHHFFSKFSHIFLPPISSGVSVCLSGQDVPTTDVVRKVGRKFSSQQTKVCLEKARGNRGTCRDLIFSRSGIFELVL